MLENEFLFFSPQLPAKEKCFNCVLLEVYFLGLAQSFCGLAAGQVTVIWEPPLWTTVSLENVPLAAAKTKVS
uniref:Uncharacterized protein n=1 Tax=Lates calcarifer TaxID=8187 RepID=A0A4W6F8K8_LATCA